MDKLRKLKRFYDRYERYLIPGALLVGFTTDVLFFRYVNFVFAMSVLFGHLLLIGCSIAAINLYEARAVAGRFFSYARVLAPLVLQYSFGACFSAFLIFYSYSGSFSASWPFISVLIFLMIANEVFRRYNTRPEIHITVYFFAIFSYTNLILPHIFKELNILLFLLSGLLSLLLIYLFVSLLYPRVLRIRERINVYRLGVGSVFLAMNLFYFTNLIPPIPLALQDIGIYYNVERINDNYRVIDHEEREWYEKLLSRKEIHIEDSPETVYAYSAVFAPSGMDLDMVHKWEYRDPEEGRWREISEISFHIVGGRDIGYRWFTYRQVWPGDWRVSVTTPDGKVTGRKTFRVLRTDPLPEREERMK